MFVSSTHNDVRKCQLIKREGAKKKKKKEDACGGQPIKRRVNRLRRTTLAQEPPRSCSVVQKKSWMAWRQNQRGVRASGLSLELTADLIIIK